MINRFLRVKGGTGVINFSKGFLQLKRSNAKIPVKGVYSGHIEELRFDIKPDTKNGKWDMDINNNEEVTLSLTNIDTEPIEGLKVQGTATQNGDSEISICKPAT